MSMYGPAAIAAALQEMGSGPGSMEDRMARALHAANSHLDYDALVDAGIAAQNAMDDGFWDQVGPVFGHDQAAYDRAVGNRRRVEAMVLLAGAGFPVDLPPVEGIEVVTLAARIRNLGRGHRLPVRLTIDGVPRDVVVDAITSSGVSIGDELVFWDRITHADPCTMSAPAGAD